MMAKGVQLLMQLYGAVELLHKSSIEEFLPLFFNSSCLNESSVIREVHGRERYEGN